MLRIIVAIFVVTAFAILGWVVMALFVDPSTVGGAISCFLSGAASGGVALLLVLESYQR